MATDAEYTVDVVVLRRTKVPLARIAVVTDHEHQALVPILLGTIGLKDVFLLLRFSTITLRQPQI